MAQSKERRLWQACTDGDLEAVRKLASDPAINVNWVGEDRGDTPLHRACRFGLLEILKVLLVQEKIEVNKGNKGNASPFYVACQEGHKEVAALLLADPRIESNRPSDTTVTPFSIACECGHKEVVSLLLADPRIGLNQPNDNEATPFFMACQNGHTEVVSLLLADPRVDPNKPRNKEATPLWFASQNGHLMAVQHLLASGKKIDTRRRSKFNDKTAAEHARAMAARTTKPAKETEDDFQIRKSNGPLCADLIDDYEREPVPVIYRLRRQPGLREYFIGHLFALVVFHSDTFVLINERTAHSDTRRFFRITSQLPLDLQMVLCNRIFGSPRDIILSRDSEPGFQLLTRTTTWH